MRGIIILVVLGGLVIAAYAGKAAYDQGDDLRKMKNYDASALHSRLSVEAARMRKEPELNDRSSFMYLTKVYAEGNTLVMVNAFKDDAWAKLSKKRGTDGRQVLTEFMLTHTCADGASHALMKSGAKLRYVFNNQSDGVQYHDATISQAECANAKL